MAETVTACQETDEGVCLNPAKPRVGLCERHYRKKRRANRGLTLWYDYRLRDAEGNKRCPSCETWLPVGAFSAHPSRDDGLSRECTSCWQTNQRRRHLKRKYGLSAEEFDALFEAQGGKCPLCLDPLPDSPCVDHDHACCGSTKACNNCVRGLLCSMCNSGIGYLRDSAEIAGRAQKYLARIG